MAPMASVPFAENPIYAVEVPHFSELRVIVGGTFEIYERMVPEKYVYEIGETFTYRLEIVRRLHGTEATDWSATPRWQTVYKSQYDRANEPNWLEQGLTLLVHPFASPQQDSDAAAIMNDTQGSPLDPRSVNWLERRSVNASAAGPLVVEQTFRCAAPGKFVGWLAVHEDEAYGFGGECLSRDLGGSTSSTSPGTDTSDDSTGGSETACELDHSDGSRPSIARTGRAALAAYPDIKLPDGLGERDVGFAILGLVDLGELCLEHVVDLYENGVVSDEMKAGIEQAAEDLAGSGG